MRFVGGVVCVVLLLLAVPLSAQDVRPVMTPVLADSTGKLIGPVVSADGMHGSIGLVGVEIEGKTAFLTFRRDIGIDEIRWWSDMFFTGPDCTGTPYLQESSIAERLAIVGGDGTLYVSDEGWDGAIRFASRVMNGACLESSNAGGVRLRATAVNMLTAFPPPYRVTGSGTRSRAVAR